MKTKSIVLRSFSLACTILFMLAFASCTKEGPNGLDGSDGADGADGGDGTASCITCHGTDNFINDAVEAFETSTHFDMGATGYAGSREGCSGCHSHQGAKHSFNVGEFVTDNMIAVNNPTSFECRTCHTIHENYDETDLKPIGAEVVTLVSNPAVEYSKEGNTNCASCHHAKDAFPVNLDDTAIEITSDRWGPHHSTQTDVRIYSLYEIVGTTSYDKSHAHDNASCVSCHMAESDVDRAFRGGHTYKVSESDELGLITAVNTNACNSCHDSGADALLLKMNETRLTVVTLVEELRTELLRIGVISTGNGRIVKQTYPSNVAGLYYNLICLEDDHSNGVHNPDYVKAVLLNSVAAAQAHADDQFALLD